MSENLPKPVFRGGKAESTDAASGIAPDRGKPWEKYGACAQASKLLPMCTQRGIALNEAKAAAGGWTPVGPLPAVVLPLIHDATDLLIGL
jgi:hypothetical protein